MEIILKEILPEINRVNRGQMNIIYEAILILREHPFIVQALVNHYYSTPKENFHQRLLTLKVVGELQRFDAFDFLRDIVWGPLPAISQGPADRITAREYEEMIQSKAVQGLAYLRNEEGRPRTEAAQETIRVIKEHPSQAVQIVAIDAYMWNHGDTKDAAATLYETLPEEFHKYVERPRFHKGMNQKVFSLRLEEWRKKWAN
jgi:hypothetical protein